MLSSDFLVVLISVWRKVGMIGNDRRIFGILMRKFCIIVVRNYNNEVKGSVVVYMVYSERIVDKYYYIVQKRVNFVFVVRQLIVIMYGNLFFMVLFCERKVDFECNDDNDLI